MRSPSPRIRLVPIAVAMVYLNGTLLLLASGIWPWPLADPLKTYGYVVLANACLLLGYLGVAFRAPRTYDGRWSRKAVLWVCAGVSLALLPVTIKARTGAWLPDIVHGLSSPGQLYARAVQAGSTGNAVEYLRIVLGVPLTL